MAEVIVWPTRSEGRAVLTSPAMTTVDQIPLVNAPSAARPTSLNYRTPTILTRLGRYDHPNRLPNKESTEMTDSPQRSVSVAGTVLNNAGQSLACAWHIKPQDDPVADYDGSTLLRHHSMHDDRNRDGGQ